MGERDVEGTDVAAAIVADATIVGNVVANRCSVAIAAAHLVCEAA
jgi:hypothetical protein